MVARSRVPVLPDSRGWPLVRMIEVSADQDRTRATDVSFAARVSSSPLLPAPGGVSGPGLLACSRGRDRAGSAQAVPLVFVLEWRWCACWPGPGLPGAGDQAADLPRSPGRARRAAAPLRRRSPRRARSGSAPFADLDGDALDVIIWAGRVPAASGRLDGLLTAIAIDGSAARGRRRAGQLFAAMLPRRDGHRAPGSGRHRDPRSGTAGPVDLTDTVITADAAPPADTAAYIAGERGGYLLTVKGTSRAPARHLRQISATGAARPRRHGLQPRADHQRSIWVRRDGVDFRRGQVMRSAATPTTWTDASPGDRAGISWTRRGLRPRSPPGPVGHRAATGSATRYAETPAR